jgi:O-antigen/teichoic acid export membrane protein
MGAAQGMSFKATGALPLRNAYTHLKGERVLTHNLIVGAGTIAAGMLGVAFQSLVSHHLRPADYGGVFAVVTLITLIGLPASSLTLLMARETSRDRATGQPGRSAALLHSGDRLLLLGGMAFAGAFALASPILAGFFGVPLPLLLAGAAGMPFGLALPLLLGEFQGEQRFLGFSLLSAGQAALKLFAAIGLGLLLGPIGIIAGISVATAIVYLAARWMLRRRLSNKPRLPWLRPAAAYLALILPSTLALAVLLSTDVLFVKHVFPGRIAGEYAAVAAIGRAIFWGAAGVAGVLFPKVIFREAQGHDGSLLIVASMFLVALGMVSDCLLWYGVRGSCPLSPLVRNRNDALRRLRGRHHDPTITC